MAGANSSSNALVAAIFMFVLSCFYGKEMKRLHSVFALLSETRADLVTSDSSLLKYESRRRSEFVELGSAFDSKFCIRREV